MADEKQLNAIRFFSRTTYSDHGVMQPVARANHSHDWSDLIQQISYFDLGHVQQDEKMVQAVARVVRKEFPNGDSWNKIANSPGSHEKILSLVRSALTAQLSLKAAAA